MGNEQLNRTLSFIAEFYGGRKFGYEGFEGYRKSTDLDKLLKCMHELKDTGLMDPDRTLFADLGCADGRVNVLVSYFVKMSVGIEIDADILAEFAPRKTKLLDHLKQRNLTFPSDNISLFRGSSLEMETYERIFVADGIRFSDFDVFYTYITLHDLFAANIAKEAKRGALYLVYGFNKVLPKYDQLDLVIPDVALQGIAALYRKR